MGSVGGGCGRGGGGGGGAVLKWGAEMSYLMVGYFRHYVQHRAIESIH